MFEIIILLGVTVLLAAIVAMLLASLGWHFTRVEKGNTVLINKGSDLKVIWPNVGGHRMSTQEDLDGRHWLVKDSDAKRCEEAFFHGTLPGTRLVQKLIWRSLAIRFVSWLFPQIRVHKFSVSRKRLQEKTDVAADTPLKGRIVKSPEPAEVSSLLFMVPRPVFVEGIELAGDNSRINLLLLVVYQQVIPSLPVYYLKGDFFPLLDAAIEAALVDFGATHLVATDKDGNFIEGVFDPEKEERGGGKKNYRPSSLTYSHWLKLAKASGSPLEEHLRGLNASREYHRRLKEAGKEELVAHLEHLVGDRLADISNNLLQDKIPHGIVPRFGFAAISVRLVDWEAHPSTKALAEALLAKETQRHAAEGVREGAYGERDALLASANGEATRYELLLDKMIEKGVDSNVAAQVLRTQIEMEQLSGSGVTTYVRGGTETGVMVNASPPASPQT